VFPKKKKEKSESISIDNSFKECLCKGMNRNGMANGEKNGTLSSILKWE
jgi:hypothetical protein